MKNANIKSIIVGVNHCFYLEKNGDLYGAGSFMKKYKFKSNKKARFERIETDVRSACTSFELLVIQKKNGEIFYIGSLNGEIVNKFRKIEVSGIISYSCGFGHCVFLSKKGEIYVMGGNTHGQLGLNLTNKMGINEPNLLMIDSNAISVCCGYSHSVILTRDEKGTVLKTFGTNANGQLGVDGNEKKINTIDSVRDIKSVHCGAHTTILLTYSGNVYASGSNSIFSKLVS
eukprot:TRINITY_DN11173_c0_g1_i1.p1 TRINITY_DN11173_c0_g1~~TRINITY_DN11173_c0_g1_i1.p1  ORF type:complete len:270 (-),score=44.64 TRINITY_DN11173_c0_g1_i1:29-718(-)